MRLLSLSNVTPWPAHGGIHLRILNLLERIATRHDVTLGCHIWDAADQEGVTELNRRGIRTIGGPVQYGSLRRHAWGAVRRAMRGVPPETAQYEAPELHRLVREGGYDLLHVEESTLAPYLDSQPATRRTPRVITMHNVHFVQDRRMARIEPTFARRAVKTFNAAWMARYEPQLARRVDHIITVSDVDRDLLQARAPEAKITVVPNGVDTRRLTPLAHTATRPAIVFVGAMSYRPCIDGAIWLARDILPRVRRLVPDVELWIVGRGAGPEVRALAAAGVHVTGEVPDVRPFYARTTLAVVPLRAGGGSRLKILEAMALGRAVVSTSLGAEGLEVEPGHHLVIADGRDQFAAAVAALLRDPARRGAHEQAGRALVEQRYDWDGIAARQLALYDALVPSSGMHPSGPHTDRMRSPAAD